jgi:hypothetical protein
VAFLRIVRDKRGYEYFSLVQATTGRRGKVRQRILYWYRTPPNIKVGRPPLDQEARRALEAQNPDVQFDWDALRDTPPPLPSVEPWRERRRAEREARQLRDTDEETEAPVLDPEPAEGDAPVDPLEAPEAEPVVESSLLIIDIDIVDIVQTAPIFSDDGPAASPGPAAVGPAPVPGRRRRHRRRGRGSRPDGPPGASGSVPLPTESGVTSSTERDHSESSDDEE